MNRHARTKSSTSLIRVPHELHVLVVLSRWTRYHICHKIFVKPRFRKEVVQRLKQRAPDPPLIVLGAAQTTLEAAIGVTDLALELFIVQQLLERLFVFYGCSMHDSLLQSIPCMF